MKRGRGGARGVALVALAWICVGCITPSGQRIPGAGRNAQATTQVFIACENIEVVPEELRESGWIFVDDAFFGYTSRPAYRRALGNALIVGAMRVEKNHVHQLKVVFKGYEPVVVERYFGNLQEYVVPFRLRPLQPKPVAAEET